VIEHFVIEPLSTVWWVGILCSISSILLVIRLLKNKSVLVKSSFARWLSLSFLMTYLISNIIAVSNNGWSLQDNLPLHLCRISFLISMIVLNTRKQWMYEWVLFLAIPSGVHAILTPEMTKGVSAWFYFDYYFVHAGLILVPIYLTIVMGMKARKDAWWKTILRLQVPVLFILPLNFLLASNYMFLKSRPLVNNPLLIGEWPIYIVFLELIMVAHIFIIHKLAPTFK
jgi:hypothetical integral membrane protein (TIGR02206 family)